MTNKRVASHAPFSWGFMSPLNAPVRSQGTAPSQKSDVDNSVTPCIFLVKLVLIHLLATFCHLLGAFCAPMCFSIIYGLAAYPRHYHLHGDIGCSNAFPTWCGDLSRSLSWQLNLMEFLEVRHTRVLRIKDFVCRIWMRLD